jgi:hypothetical protein
MRGRIAQWLWLKVLILLLLAPWLVKNFIFTGNPLYPYFSSWFGGQTLPASNFTALMFDHETPWAVNHSLGEWALQVVTRDLDKTVAPLLLVFVPFLFVSKTWKNSTCFLFWTSLLYLLMGLAVSHQLRLLIPAVVLLLTAMGKILSLLNRSRIRAWAWVVLVFGLLSFVSLARVGVSYYHLGEMLTGFKTEKEYLKTSPQTQSYYGLAVAAQSLTVPGERLLVAGDARSLYFSRDFYAQSVFDPPLLVVLAQSEKNADGIRHRLRELGIDDLAVSGEEGRRLATQNAAHYDLSEPDWQKLDGLIQHWCDPLYLLGGQGLYRLRSMPVIHRKPVPDTLLWMKSPKPN